MRRKGIRWALGTLRVVASSRAVDQMDHPRRSFCEVPAATQALAYARTELISPDERDRLAARGRRKGKVPRLSWRKIGSMTATERSSHSTSEPRGAAGVAQSGPDHGRRLITLGYQPGSKPNENVMFATPVLLELRRYHLVVPPGSTTPGVSRPSRFQSPGSG